MKAEIITIGDEILIGQIVDTNSAWIAKKLQHLCVEVVQMISISDQEKEILETLHAAGKRADLVIITGGLGPTNDDVTKQTAAKFFETTLIRDEKVYQHVADFFTSRGREMLPINDQQADVLQGCEVLFNDFGTAPGMWIEKAQTKYVFLPGVPFEMKFLMENRVLPKLSALTNQLHIQHEHIIVAGIGESFLADKIKDIEAEIPSHIKLSYLPTFNMIRLRLTGMSENSEKLDAELSNIKTRIISRVVENVVADYDTTLDAFIVKTFIDHQWTLSTAESCTGGNIAAQITAHAGASALFLGGTVPYSNEMKTKMLGVPVETLQLHGAVSEQTVKAMAEGVRQLTGSDYAIATSGIAGPGGGTTTKPVGTIWIAIANEMETVAKVFHFKNDRSTNVQRTVQMAFFMLWKFINHKKQV